MQRLNIVREKVRIQENRQEVALELHPQEEPHRLTTFTKLTKTAGLVHELLRVD